MSTSNECELYYIRLVATTIGILVSGGLSIRYVIKWIAHSKQPLNTVVHETGLYTTYWTSVHHAIFIWAAIAVVLVGVLVYLLIQRPARGRPDPEESS